MAIVRPRSKEESAYKQTYTEQQQNEMCGRWIDDMIKVLGNGEQSVLSNMVDAKEYLIGVWDIAFDAGCRQQMGHNLITLINEEDGI